VLSLSTIKKGKLEKMKKVHLGVIIAGAAVGLAALILTALGNPTNMGFCIACFLRDISGAVGLHSAAKVQYVRPEIIGLVLGAFIMSVASKEFKARRIATRFAEKQGYKVEYAAEGEDFRLKLNK
jgi:putative membrane protein